MAVATLILFILAWRLLEPSTTPQLLWERHLSSWTSIEMPPIPIDGTGLAATERSYGRVDIVTAAYSATVVLERQLVSALPDETCEPGVDADGDGLAGCDDPDCWWKCHPACPYQGTCP